MRDQQLVGDEIYSASNDEILRAYKRVTLLPQIELMISGQPLTLSGIVSELRAEYAPVIDWSEAEWTRQVRRRLRILERLERLLRENDTYVGMPKAPQAADAAMFKLLFAPELGDTARRGLEAGNIIYTAILDYDLEDFSPAIAQWTAAVEKELGLKFFADFRYCLTRQSEYRETDLKGLLSDDLADGKTKLLARYILGEYRHLTIGQMQRFLSYLHGKKLSSKSWAVAELLTYTSQAKRPRFFIDPSEASSMLTSLNDEFRKDSHHMNKVFNTSEARDCRNLVVRFLQGLLDSCR